MGDFTSSSIFSCNFSIGGDSTTTGFISPDGFCSPPPSGFPSTFLPGIAVGKELLSFFLILILIALFYSNSIANGSRIFSFKALRGRLTAQNRSSLAQKLEFLDVNTAMFVHVQS